MTISSWIIVCFAIAVSTAAAKECGNGTMLANFLRWRHQGRIVGGVEAPKCGIPWQVRLDPLCGGSIISPYHVLTAAHCVQDLQAHQMSVVVGDHDWTSDQDDGTEQRIRVKKIIMHWEYNKDTVENDAAILLLERPITYNECVQPICLDPSFNFDGKECIVSGWGTTTWQGQVSDKLKMVEVMTYLGHRCREVFNTPDWYGGNEKYFICAGVVGGGKDSCQGDSGGPLYCPKRRGSSEFVQVGVVSWGGECAKEGFPGFYTYLRNYHGWINWIMRSFPK